jgi:hypothetical protein
MDHNDREVFYLNFWNPKTIIFRGVFRMGDAVIWATDESVVGTATGPQIRTFSYDCFGGQGGISFWKDGTLTIGERLRIMGR